MSSLFETENIPLICVPLTAKTENELMEQLDEVTAVQPDVIEWRADFYEQLDETEKVIHLVKRMKEQTDVPLLFTIRSEEEGGEPITLEEAEKVKLIQAICRETNIEAVDYEVENNRKYVAAIRDVAKEHDVELLLSYHHFSKTPSNEELIKIGAKMELLEADVAKIAVMPQSRTDVSRLLHITTELDELLQVPVITMSMGELGVLSRVIGWAYGSCLTFAVGVESSAPGQVPVRELRSAIGAVQRTVKNYV